MVPVPDITSAASADNAVPQTANPNSTPSIRRIMSCSLHIWSSCLPRRPACTPHRVRASRPPTPVSDRLCGGDLSSVESSRNPIGHLGDRRHTRSLPFTRKRMAETATKSGNIFMTRKGIGSTDSLCHFGGRKNLLEVSLNPQNGSLRLFSEISQNSVDG